MKTQMQKEMILEKLKENGCRITRQRRLILDIILEEDCNCCKEIFYKASKKDEGIGAATVYRMVNMLEKIGAINRKNMYKVAYSPNCLLQNACTVVLDDDSSYNLSAKEWNEVIRRGLSACGYLKNQGIESVTITGCDCDEKTC